jgi:lipopolysaccharide transport system ATP-binding protein
VNQTQAERISIGYDLRTLKGDVVFGSGAKFNCELGVITELTCQIPDNFLNDDAYQIHLYIHTEDMKKLFSEMELLTFEIKDVKRETGYLGKVNGLIRPLLNWEMV